MLHATENKLLDSRRDRLIDELLKTPLAHRLAEKLAGDGADAVRASARRALSEISTDHLGPLEAAGKAAIATRDEARRALEAAEGAARVAVDKASTSRQEIADRKATAAQIAGASSTWLESQNLLTAADVERQLGLTRRA